VSIDETVRPEENGPAGSQISQSLKGRSRCDLLAILELVETLVRGRDWDGLTELFRDT